MCANKSKWVSALPIETTIKMPGTPKANEKQPSSSKQLMSLRKIGVTNVEMSEPELIEK